MNVFFWIDFATLSVCVCLCESFCFVLAFANSHTQHFFQLSFKFIHSFYMIWSSGMNFSVCSDHFYISFKRIFFCFVFLEKQNGFSFLWRVIWYVNGKMEKWFDFPNQPCCCWWWWLWFWPAKICFFFGPDPWELCFFLVPVNFSFSETLLETKTRSFFFEFPFLICFVLSFFSQICDSRSLVSFSFISVLQMENSWKLFFLSKVTVIFLISKQQTSATIHWLIQWMNRRDVCFGCCFFFIDNQKTPRNKWINDCEWIWITITSSGVQRKQDFFFVNREKFENQNSKSKQKNLQMLEMFGILSFRFFFRLGPTARRIFFFFG